VLLEGGRRYAPFVIANGGNLGGSLQGSIQAFLTKNPDNVAATLENYIGLAEKVIEKYRSLNQ
jgi:hypothetical protein